MEYRPDLLKSELFADVSYEDLERLLGCIGARVRHYIRGDIIVQVGEMIPQLLVVLKGTMKTSHVSNVNAEGTVSTYHPCEHFGMAYAVLGRPSFVSARAVTACSILFIPYDKLICPCERHCEGHAQVLHNIPAVLADKVLMHAQKIEYLHLRSLRSKLSAYLLNNQGEEGAEFTIPLNRTQLAEYLGASRSSMTRELSTMQREGLVHFEGKVFQVLNKERLLHYIYD